MNGVFTVTSATEALPQGPGANASAPHQWIVTLTAKPGGAVRGTLQLVDTSALGYAVGSELTIPIPAPPAPPAKK